MRASPSQVRAEVAALRRVRGKLPESSGFRESNYACIDAQIEALTGNVEWTSTRTYWASEYVQEHALYAFEWFYGMHLEKPYSRLPIIVPSEEWKRLVPKKKSRSGGPPATPGAKAPKGGETE